MPCKSWSLPALSTCPGARLPGGAIVEACQFCYARTGHYRFPSTVALREHNRADWKRRGFVDAMVQAIESQPPREGGGEFFRWFDSGDIYTPALARKILQVIRRTPACRHWIPTRSYKDARILPWLDLINREPNAVVRFSSDSVHGEELGMVAGRNWWKQSSVIVQNAGDWFGGKGKALCRSWTRGGKCGPCRACWSKDVSVVAYPIHGRKL